MTRCTCGGFGAFTQPEWKTVAATDYSRIQVDQTGQYGPEMEVAQEFETARGRTNYLVYRFSLDRLKVVNGHLVPEGYQKAWPHPVHMYVEWFTEHLAAVASAIGSSEKALVKAFCSADYKERAWAWESVGQVEGFENLDQYPQTLTEKELNKRWDS